MWYARVYKGAAYRYGSKTGRLQYLGVDGNWYDQKLTVADGYFVIGVERKAVRVHCLVWYLVKGAWPMADIDHIDGNGLNNAICNLREVSRVVNSHNRGKNSNNTSGHKGVYLEHRTKRWYANIKVRGKKYSGPYRATKEEAIQDRKDLEARFQNVIQLPLKEGA